MKTGIAQPVPDANAIRFSERARAWVDRTGVKSLCAVRVHLEEKESDKRYGALTVYRQRPGAWGDDEVKLLQLFAMHIPALYRTVRDRMSFRILEAVSDVIREAEEDNDPRREMIRKLFVMRPTPVTRSRRKWPRCKLQKQNI